MLTVGSLCSGYGGLDLGLQMALGQPLRHAWHVEYDKHPSAILSHHWPDVPNYGDVNKTDWTSVEPVDWLTAGYPCQPFSLAGLRLGEDDPRHLWPGVAHAIGVLRPRNVLLENVSAHLRVGFTTVLADLADLGYDASWGVVRASDAGAPHARARLFVVARDTDGSTSGEWRLAAPGQAEGGRSRADAGGSGRALSAADTDDAAADRERARPALGRRGEVAAADTDGQGGSRLRRREAAELSLAGVDGGDGRPGPSQPADADRAGLEGGEPAGGRVLPSWGTYEPAVRRWERVTGRDAPRPTEPGRTGERLSPRFVEWLMGLPAGWVTEVPGLPRNAQLKALGNGVVPQQAALAVRLLTARVEAVAA